MQNGREITRKNFKTENVRNLNKSIGETWKEYLLESWPSYLEGMSLMDSDLSADFYRMFTFERLHNLFLCVSKLS